MLQEQIRGAASILLRHAVIATSAFDGNNAELQRALNGLAV